MNAIKNKWLNNFNCNSLTLHSECFDTLDWALWRIYSLQKHLHIKIHIPVQLAEIYHQLAFLLLTKNTYWLSAQHSEIMHSVNHSSVFFHRKQKRTQKSKPSHRKRSCQLLIVLLVFSACRFHLIFCVS